MEKGQKKKNSKTKKSKNLEVIIGIVCIILLFFGVLKIDDNGNISIAWNNDNSTQVSNNDISKEIKENKLYIYYFDVGQADSIFVYNNNETMLIDAGNNPDGELICDYLKTLGITRIDYLIGTHPHEDHIGGLDDIINTFDIGTIYMPKYSATTKTFEDILDAVSNKNLKVFSPKVGLNFKIGNAICEIMSIEDNASEANLASICIEMTYGTQKYLFTGDMEAENESARYWDCINVLKVAHHGSNTSSTEKFLKQVQPEIAIISCEEDNSYGHPHKEVLERLEKIGCEVYRTDIQGTILLESDGTTNKLEFLDVCLNGND